jgi:D-alanyl-D-alanine carboxypeptidase
MKAIVGRTAQLAVVAIFGAALLQCSAPTPPATAPSLPAPAPSPPAPAPSPSPAPPATATVSPVTAAELGGSWRPGCPVGPEQLRRVQIDYVGFDGQTHGGELIVHENLVADVIAIFGQLRQLRYPIAGMRTVDHYPGADDELSMEDNNTSAFNCRVLPGSGRWSQHAYGRAIDINPVLNPYIDRTGAFQPKNAAPYLDRSRRDPGLLHDGDPVVRVFTDRGWRWGGHWRTPVDYQHFERT